MAFPEILCAIWLGRNDACFNGKLWDSHHFLDMAKLHVAWWAHAKRPHSNLSIQDLVRFPNAIIVLSKPLKTKPDFKWQILPSGVLKCNIDGTSSGNPGEVGIGGPLRDENGDVLLLFSLSIGIMDANSAEFKALCKAPQMFANEVAKSLAKSGVCGDVDFIRITSVYLVEVC
ncbi:Uncharacterized protein TCM_032444 [Theobroma cacao]|uniref:RNase H type-1 domain-containing protein n=1 Tax=Theobroma cacao TaxID=3641 RepID=A0A061FA77_THECC|nr:Uncharacterized protein TCM_032444 [Theobroma cacao]